MTPADLLAAYLRRDGTRPFLTWYDDATGERVELSVATTANWAAKAANHLVDELGLDVGDVVGLEPSGHWTSVVAVLGAWTAGVAVQLPAAAADARVPGEPAAFIKAVLPQPDALLVKPPGADEVAVRTDERDWTLGELVAGVDAPPACVRLPTTLALDSVQGLLAAVIGPLVAGGSAVVVRNGEPAALAARAQVERVTHTAGCDVPGLTHFSC